MTTFFVDTSALVKRYIRETGSLWVRTWIAPDANNLIIISDTAVVEMFSLLARRKRADVIGNVDHSTETGFYITPSTGLRSVDRR